MKMTIVSAFNIKRKPKFKLLPKTELEGKVAISFGGIANLLVEDDEMTVEMPEKGYKQVSQ